MASASRIGSRPILCETISRSMEVDHPLGASVVLLLNKPKNIVSTVKDPQGRPTVMDFLKGVKQRVYPVGRLDFDTKGSSSSPMMGTWPEAFPSQIFRFEDLLAK